MHLSLRRVLVAVALAVALAGLLTAPVLAASDPSRAAAPPAASSVDGSGLAGQLWSWMRTIWPQSGCTIDPDGQCRNAAPPIGTLAGAAAAPRRLSRSDKVRPTSGCGIDPGGQCG